jgi:hypothetical protein
MAEQTPLGWHPPPVWTPPAQFPAPSVPIELHIPHRKPTAVIGAGLAVVLIGAGSAASFVLMQSDALGDIQFGTARRPPSADSNSTLRLDRSPISGKLTSLDVGSASKVYLDQAKVIGKRKLDKRVRVTER